MFLKKGDLVDIVSPASSVTKIELAQVKLFLEKNGLRARFFLEKELVLNKKPSNSFSAFK